MEVDFVVEEELRQKNQITVACPSAKVNQWVCSHMEYYTAVIMSKLPLHPAVCIESHKPHAKQWKPDTKEYILCNSINMKFKTWQN